MEIRPAIRQKGNSFFLEAEGEAAGEGEVLALEINGRELIEIVGLKFCAG